MQPAGEFGMLTESVAVPADVHDVAVVDEPVDEGGGHHLIPEDLPQSSKPLLLVRIVDACS